MERDQLAEMEPLPPGTQRIENETGAHIVLSPVPSADPNQPLVSSANSTRDAFLTVDRTGRLPESRCI